MFILFSLSSGLEFWSVNNTLLYENSELKVFNNSFFSEVSSNWRNDLLGTNAYNILEYCCAFNASK